MFKNGFSLLLTLLIITLFSTLSIFIIELSNISTNIDTKNLLYTQADLHMTSTVNLLSQIDIYDESEDCIDNMVIDEKFFDIKLYFSYISKRKNCNNILSDNFDDNITKGMAIIDIFVKSKNDIYNITLHKRVVKKLE